MGTLLHDHLRTYTHRHDIHVWKKFIAWCRGQEENRLAWLAVSFMVHGCIFLPMTIGIIAMSGNNFIFVAIALASMIVAITVNLATLPARITLPVFFFTIILDMMIIIACLVHGVNINRLFTR